MAQERLPAAAALDPVGIVREFSESLRGELDYRVEARNTDRFRANFAKEKYIYAPRSTGSTPPGASRSRNASAASRSTTMPGADCGRL